jgi:predicted dithiol-disulfide oxidoreductase (DUF899 family)
MTLPEIVSREEWVQARTALLAEEKALMKRRDALSADRRRLPMVEITKRYEFDAPEGKVTLLDLFEGRRQLIVGHFMFDPEWEKGCPGCTAGADELAPGLIAHLAARDTAVAHVSRAPLEKIERYKAERGWTFRWVSSYDSDFNYDFHVTVDPARGSTEYNFREVDAPGEYPGTSCFLRDGDRIFHTYSMFGRGAEQVGGGYYWLDLTALGRQEDWEEPKGRADAAAIHGPDPTFT